MKNEEKEVDFGGEESETKEEKKETKRGIILEEAESLLTQGSAKCIKIAYICVN